MATRPAPTPGQDRLVRLFVSSTFRDMHAEREELVKKAFPVLRRKCESRGVTWAEVDLRWGISEDRAEREGTLRICLAEIARCRPFFICILGERYGWVPDHLPPELAAAEPWLRDQAGTSITELEILHGALNKSDPARQCFFYFRDPAWCDRLPAGADRNDFLAESPRAAARLRALKQRIRESGLPVRENYRSPHALAELVLQDLGQAIDALFPDAAPPGPLDREAAEHEAFAASRRAFYAGLDRYYAPLDAHADGDGPPLVVTGESGSGKSALLANWVTRHKSRSPADECILHFVGATPFSSDWAAMLRRLLAEFKRRFGIPEEVPDRIDLVGPAFRSWLHRAPAGARVILVLDGLDQLEDDTGLAWLPPLVPGNVRCLISAAPGPALEALRARGWPVFPLRALDAGEREQLIQAYLRHFGKQLAPEQTLRITGAAQCGNALFLRTLLDELRVWGGHESVDAHIERCLEPETMEQLYSLILQRCETDFEQERPGLVRDAMSLLWASRRGLSQTELLGMLGTAEAPLPSAVWAPFSLALDHALLDRAGLLGFSHPQLREAVHKRYLPDPGQETAARKKIVDYFQAADLAPRKIEELPWQLARAGMWMSLAISLSDLPFLEAALEADPFDVRAYWTQVERHYPRGMRDVYRAVISMPEMHPGFAFLVAGLLGDLGHEREALSIFESLRESCRRTGDREHLAACLINEAKVRTDLKEEDRAFDLYEEAAQVSKEIGAAPLLALSLGNQAGILRWRGRLAEAARFFKEEESVYRGLGDLGGLARNLGNQAAMILDHRTASLDEALQLLKEAERLARLSGQRDLVASGLGRQALILKERGDFRGALELLRESERICRELGDRPLLAWNLNHQAAVRLALGEQDASEALLEEAGQQLPESTQKISLAEHLYAEAGTVREQGQLDRALSLLRRAEHLCRESAYDDGLARILNGQALILRAQREPAAAFALLQEAEGIARRLGSAEILVGCLTNQVLLLGGELDRPREALALAEEAFDLATRSGLHASAEYVKPYLEMLRKEDAGQRDLALRRARSRWRRLLGIN